jgi:predicted DsbA family dithiol-disulfide isomerase
MNPFVHSWRSSLAPAGLMLLMLAGLVAAQSLDELRSHDLLTDVDLSIRIPGAQSLGDNNAGVVIVEFFDFQCPYCAVHVEQTLPRVLDEYVKTGKVRYVFLNFPNEKIHPLAPKAAEMAECAAEQGKYWEAHLQLYKNQRDVDTKTLGLDRSRFEECVDTGQASAKVQSDLEQGRKIKTPGTPSFYFGNPDPEDPSTIHAVKLLVGSQTFHVFTDLFEEFLNPVNSQAQNAHSARPTVPGGDQAH